MGHVFLFVVELRCGPCQGIAPHFEQFPKKYPQVIFLKVDVDKCQETAVSQGVKAMPTFVFYRNKVSFQFMILHARVLNSCSFRVKLIAYKGLTLMDWYRKFKKILDPMIKMYPHFPERVIL